MNPIEFNSLPLGEQAILLWDQGKFIELWQNNIYKIGIYQMEGLIVSVYYNDKDENKIIRIRMWDDVINENNVLQNIIKDNVLSAAEQLN